MFTNGIAITPTAFYLGTIAAMYARTDRTRADYVNVDRVTGRPATIYTPPEDIERRLRLTMP